MDLLRLVLARQPLQKLLTLPKLMGSRRFLLLRSSLLNRKLFLQGSVDDYIKACTHDGELTEFSIHYCSAEQHTYRAAFLLNAALHNRYYSFCTNVDFWAALATGVPEIQAAVIADAMVTIEKSHYIQRDQITLYAGERRLRKVNWTPGLRKAFSHHVAPLLITLEMHDLAVLGYLGLDVGTIKIGTDDTFSYIWGFCLARYEGEEQIQKDEETDRLFSRLYGVTISEVLSQHDTGQGDIYGLIVCLVRGGYTHYILSMDIGILAAYATLVARTATESVRYQVLYYVSNFLPTMPPVGVPANLDRVKTILSPTWTSFLTPYLRAYYRISLGERVDIRDHPNKDVLNNFLFSVGIPTFDRPQIDIDAGQELSDRLIYDSAAVLEQNWDYTDVEADPSILEIDAFRLGRGNGEISGAFPPTVIGNLGSSHSDNVLDHVRNREELEAVEKLQFDEGSNFRTISVFEKQTLKYTITRIETIRDKILPILKGQAENP